MDSNKKKTNINEKKINSNEKKINYNEKNDEKNNNDIFKFKKLTFGPRNFLSYFFIDRYSILYMSNNLDNDYCTNKVNYNVVEKSTEVCSYYFSTRKITKTNQELIDNYSDLLRKFVANRHPPYLCLLKNKLNIFTIEMITHNIDINIPLSTKNTSDLIFQILITLYCIYKYKFKFTKFNLLHVFSSIPVTLIYKIGNLQFTLEGVNIFPFFSIDNNTIIENLNNDPNYDIKITNSYNELVTLILNARYNNIFPFIEENTCACLLSHLLLLFGSKSNICRFDEINDKKSNKYLNEFCLQEKSIGNVYKKDNDLYIFVGYKKFYNLNNGNILEMDKTDLILLYDIKEIKQSKDVSQVYIFDV